MRWRDQLMTTPFVLLALSARIPVEQGCSGSGTRSKSLLAFIDRDLRSPNGGFIEGIPAAMPAPGKNPQMHLFESDDRKHSTANGAIPYFRIAAGRIVQSLRREFIRFATVRFLGEYFEEDWSRIGACQ